MEFALFHDIADAMPRVAAIEARLKEFIGSEMVPEVRTVSDSVSTRYQFDDALLQLSLSWYGLVHNSAHGLTLTLWLSRDGHGIELEYSFTLQQWFYQIVERIGPDPCWIDDFEARFAWIKEKWKTSRGNGFSISEQQAAFLLYAMVTFYLQHKEE